MARAQDVDARGPRVVELPEILDLKAAAPLASEFLAYRGDELNVDASRVQRLGGQCLQVLLSAATTWKVDEIPLAFVKASTGFVDGLQRLGIAPADFIDQEAPQ